MHCWEIDVIMTLDDLLSLNRDLVSINSYNPSTGRCAVKLRHLRTHIIVTLTQRIGRTKYQMSHALKTPLMKAPFQPAEPYGDDSQDALCRAIGDLVADYRSAIDARHKPDESWLVANG